MMSVATEKRAKSGGLGETVKIVIQALLLALVVRTLPVPAVQHPVRLDEVDAAGRRLPVRLEIRLRLLAASRCRSGSPLFDGRIWSAPPERGDIVVFKLPRDNSTDYIKRVIGLPGDRIQMKDGVLYINDEAVQREQVDDRIDDDGFRLRALPRDAAERRQLPHARPRRRTASRTTPRSTRCRPTTTS